jgi:hypothetical protein
MSVPVGLFQHAAWDFFCFCAPSTFLPRSRFDIQLQLLRSVIATFLSIGRRSTCSCLVKAQANHHASTDPPSLVLRLKPRKLLKQPQTHRLDPSSSSLQVNEVSARRKASNRVTLELARQQSTRPPTTCSNFHTPSIRIFSDLEALPEIFQRKTTFELTFPSK